MFEKNIRRIMIRISYFSLPVYVSNMEDVSKIAQGKKVIISENNYQDQVKLHLNWTKQEWIKSGKNGTVWNKHISFYKYWNTKLKEIYDDNTTIITLYNVEKEAYIDVEKILEALAEIIPLENLEGFFKVRNTRLLGLEFKDFETKSIVEKNFKFVEDNNVGFLNWALNEGIINITVHWLPSRTPKQKIADILEKYITIQTFEEEKTDFDCKKNCKAGRFFVKGKLHDKMFAEDIPHLFMLGHKEGLFTVRGRAPLCLNCEEVGHMAADCLRPFCSTCRIKMPKKHSCDIQKTLKKTYAQKLKVDDNNEFFESYTNNKEKNDQEENQNTIAEMNEKQISYIEIAKNIESTGAIAKNNSTVSVQIKDGLEKHIEKEKMFQMEFNIDHSSGKEKSRESNAINDKVNNHNGLIEKSDDVILNKKLSKNNNEKPVQRNRRKKDDILQSYTEVAMKVSRPTRKNSRLKSILPYSCLSNNPYEILKEENMDLQYSSE